MTYTPTEVIKPAHRNRWCLSCEHATNTVPDAVAGGDLGLPASEMARHIAFDPGAAGVTRALAQVMGAQAVLSNFSRLVVDPNRGLDDPTLFMQLYDGTIIPANRKLSQTDKETRLALCYHPYDHAMAQMLDAVDQPILVSIHSFTPKLKNRSKRPWEIGVLYGARETAFATAVLTELRAQPDLTVGENQPYNGELPGDATDRHARQQGRPNVLIELRQDEIDTPAKQQAWAERLAPLLDAARIKAQV